MSRLWPLPALLTWALAWGLALGLRRAEVPQGLVLACPAALGVLIAAVPRVAETPWRKALVALGFPVSAVLSGLGQGVPAWVWLLPLAVLMLAYPLQAWRDAPVFPTPADALLALPQRVPLPDAGVHILDAGCGMGDALWALHRAYPQAQLDGVEWSWVWRVVAAWRCPFARVRQGDMWRMDWAPYDMVYVFQRPESMSRAMRKAAQEMRPGTFLVSLEFQGVNERGQAMAPDAQIMLPSGRPIWIYRMRVGKGG